MRFSMLLVGLVVTATAAVACGGSDDNGGGGTAGKGGSGTAGSNNSAGSNSSGSGTGGSGTASTGSGGGTGSGTPGKVDSGAPDNTPASELTDEQFDALCKSLGQTAGAVLGEDAKKATCGFAAYFATTLSGAMGDAAAAACKMAYDECLADPEETTDDECTKPSSSCTATVGEIETCLNDTIVQSKAAFAELPGCDDLGKEFETPAESQPPASCQVVQEKCPEVLE